MCTNVTGRVGSRCGRESYCLHLNPDADRTSCSSFQVEKLVGSDSADYHRFGDSVTIQTDVSGDVYVAVGAPYAQDYGTLEVQKIVCRECSLANPPCLYAMCDGVSCLRSG